MTHIRDAIWSDRTTLACFNAAMARETEDRELDAELLQAGVDAVLRDAGKGFYLMAERDGESVGQLLITFEWSDWRNGVFWWIQSVYVHPENRRQGVFRSLYEDVLRRAERAQNVCGLRLCVERGNAAAQAVYRRLGMGPTIYEMFELAVEPPFRKSASSQTASPGAR